MVAIGTESAAQLEQIALDAAREWVDWWVSKLAHEGRPMSGGWPGTLSEARARFARLAAASGGQHTLDSATLDMLIRRTYVAARAGWLARASREPTV